MSNLIALSQLSDLWIVAQPGTGYECRKCRLAADATTTVPNADVLLMHLEKHRAARHSGATLAIQRLLACGTCGGKGKFQALDPLSHALVNVSCSDCKGDGLNALGKKHPEATREEGTT